MGARRRRPASCLAIALYALVAALATVTALAAGARPARAEPTPGPATKYYVVEASINGQREFLYDIARRTLGDGNRYMEIFKLNRDRPQPDGGRLTDPAVVNPGWVLILPADAHGPGVHEGPLPEFGPGGSATPPAPPGPPASSADMSTVRTGAVIATAAAGVLLAGMGVRRWARRRSRRVPPDDAAEPMGEPPLTAFQFGAVVRNGSDAVQVRLVGAAERGRPPYRWVDPDQPGVDQAGLVSVGASGRAVLLIDLSLSPDAVTLAGPAASLARLVHAWTRQLTRHRVDVIVVGGVADAPASAGVRAVRTFQDIGPGDLSAAVVIFGPPSPAPPPAVRPGVVVVIVGAPVRSRWSVEFQSEDATPMSIRSISRVENVPQ